MPSLDEHFPALATWTQDHGWIEVGLIEGFKARVQVVDEGGLIWSGASSYPSLMPPSKRPSRPLPSGWRSSSAGELRHGSRMWGRTTLLGSWSTR
jgi:hypothetical protein